MSWLIDALRQPVVELAQLAVTSAALALAALVRRRQERNVVRLENLEAQTGVEPPPGTKPSASSSRASDTIPSLDRPV